MRRKTKLILLFYRPWAVASNLATAVCVWFVAKSGLMMLPLLLLFKAGMSALIWYFVREYGARRIYYFTNLGLSPRTLWSLSMGLDILIFLICVTVAAIW
jgi:hypothetical protein